MAGDNYKHKSFLNNQTTSPNIRLCSLAADVLFAVFAPAFPFVVPRQEIRPQTAKAHSLRRYGQS